MDSDTFNPALMSWLNELDYCSGDWPHSVPDRLLNEADVLFGGGFKLGENGHPATHVRADIDPLYLGC